MNKKTQYWLDQIFLLLVLIDPLGGIRILAGKQMELGLIQVFVVQLLFLAYLYNHVHSLSNMFGGVVTKTGLKEKKTLMSQGPMVFCMSICMMIFGKMMPSILYVYKEHNFFDMLLWTIILGYLVWRFMDTEFCKNITGSEGTPVFFKRIPWLMILTAAFSMFTTPFPWNSMMPMIRIWGASMADMVILTVICKISQKRAPSA